MRAYLSMEANYSLCKKREEDISLEAHPQFDKNMCSCACVSDGTMMLSIAIIHYYKIPLYIFS
jgi:hypothetical protein